MGHPVESVLYFHLVFIFSGPKSYAISTFPEEVGLCISTIPLAGYGVYARHYIPIGTWIGPYEGKKIPVEDGLKMASQGDASFLWEVCLFLNLLMHIMYTKWSHFPRKKII